MISRNHKEHLWFVRRDCARDAHGHPARESERLTDSRLLFEDQSPCDALYQDHIDQVTRHTNLLIKHAPTPFLWNTGMLRAEFGQTMDPNGVHFTADYFLPANSQECQGRRHATLALRPADDLRVGGGGHGGSPRVDSEVISVGQRCAIKPIIARRTDVRKWAPRAHFDARAGPESRHRPRPAPLRRAPEASDRVSDPVSGSGASNATNA